MASPQEFVKTMSLVFQGLESEKIPTDAQTLDWTERTELATFYVAGNTLEDLDNRSTVNQVLRTHDPDHPMVVQVLRQLKKASIAWTGTEVPLSVVEQATQIYEEKWDAAVKGIEDHKIVINTPPAGRTASDVKTIQQIQSEERLAIELKNFQAQKLEAGKVLDRIRNCLKAREEVLFNELQKEKSKVKDPNDWTPEVALATEEKLGAVIQPRYPVIVTGQTRVVVHHRCKAMVPENLYPWILRQWSKVRGKSPHCLQWTTVARVGPGGKPCVLKDEQAATLSKWMRGKLDSRPSDLVAHFWLIVSWNRAHPRDKVDLPKGCRNPYSRSRDTPSDPRQKKKKAVVPDSQSGAVEEMASKLEALQKLLEAKLYSPEEVPAPPVEGNTTFPILGTALSKLLTWQYGAGKLYRATEVDDGLRIYEAPGKPALLTSAVREYLDILGQLNEAKEKLSRMAGYLDELEEDNKALWAAQYGREKEEENAPQPEDTMSVHSDDEPQLGEDESPPDIFMDGGFLWYLDPHQVSGPKMSRSFFGRDYFRVFTKEKPRPENAGPAPQPKKVGPDGAQGKQEGTSVKTGEEKVPSVSKVNPLRAKGTPRSALLTDEQKSRLRKALEIKEPEPLDPQLWQTMSAKAKTAYRKATAIPHWATSAVIDNEENLSLIEAKVLTADNPKAKLPKGPSSKKTKDVKDVAGAWAELKKRYSGTGLYSNPKTKKEKSLKSGYDSLKSEFGNHPCLPKPKLRPQRGGTTQPGLQSSNQGLDSLIPLLGFIGKLAKALG
jgi:hypothetical protein